MGRIERELGSYTVRGLSSTRLLRNLIVLPENNITTTYGLVATRAEHYFSRGLFRGVKVNPLRISAGSA